MANSILHTTIIEKNASGDKTIIYPKNTTKDVLDGSQSLEQTLNTLKSNNISNKTTAFTQAATRQNLASGETIATSHGKIMKLISDLKSLAFLDKVGVANLDGTLTTEYNKRITTDKVTTSTSITSAGYVADARAINSLQNQINTLNSNYTSMGTAYKNADSSLQSQINTLNSKYTTVQNGITDLGKSVANGKNLIGGVVGGNSSSTFATLANNVQTIKNQRDNYSSRLSNSLNLETIYIGSSGLTIRSSYTSFPILFIGGSSNSAYDMKLFFYAYEYGGYKRFVRREDDHYTWGITYNDYTFADKRAYPIPYYGTSVNYSKIRYSVSVSNDIITLTITPYDSKYIQNYTRILYYK